MSTNIPPEELWRTILGEIELTVSRANFQTWFQNSTLHYADEGVAVIVSPNVFTRDWLANKYHKIIFQAIKSSNPQIQSVRYELSSEQHGNMNPIGKSGIRITKRTKQKDTPIVQHSRRSPELNPDYTFNSFVVGSHSELAFAACQAVSENPGVMYNPLFIYGGVGLGKTHLLQATGNTIANLHGKNVMYLTSERFSHELITAIRERTAHTFKSKHRNIDVLIVDDIQFLAGKEKTQDEFFHTFNELYSCRKQIVMSSDRPPKAIGAIEDRLRSRFEGGMIADINMPDLETRVAILEKKCERKSFQVPRDVLQFIAAHITTNIRELEGALNRVVADCQLRGCPITTDHTKELLSPMLGGGRRQVVHSKKILDAVCGYYNIPANEIIGKSRKKEVVVPRQIAMYLLREEGGSTYPSIGSVFGGRDHTTAMHACEKISSQMNANEVLYQDITFIKQQLYV